MTIQPYEVAGQIACEQIPADPDIPPDRDPARAYMGTLDSEHSRLAMERSLGRIVKLMIESSTGTRLPDDMIVSPYQRRWWLLRREDTLEIRRLLCAPERKVVNGEAVGYAPATINQHLAALRRVLEECWTLGLIDGDEYQRAVKVKDVKGTRVIAGREIHDDEMGLMLSMCLKAGRTEAIRLRDAALLMVLASTGVRAAEAAGARIEDYDARSRMLKIRGKGNKERLVAVHKRVIPHLEKWLACLSDRRGPIFRTVDRHGVIKGGMTTTAISARIKKIYGLTGMPKLSPHDFRRTFIGKLLDSGADLAQAQKLAGHASATTTARYDRRDDRKLRDAVDRMDIVVPEDKDGESE